MNTDCRLLARKLLIEWYGEDFKETDEMEMELGVVIEKAVDRWFRKRASPGSPQE